MLAVFRRMFLTILLLMVSSLNFAQSEEPHAYSFGIEGARQAGLVKPLNLSHTIRGVTVHIHWVYLDARTFTIRYYVDGVRGAREVFKSPVRLTDEMGNEFTCARGGRSGSPDFSAPITAHSVETECIFNEAYLKGLGNEVRELSFTLEFNTGGYLIPDPLMVASPTPPSPEKTAEPMPPDIFRFDFTVPYYPAVEVEVNQTVTADGVAVTLQSLSLTPASTVMTVCYDLPEGQEWNLGNPTAELNGELFPTMMVVELMPVANGCVNRKHDVFYDGSASTLYFAFDYLQVGGIDWFPKDREGWERLIPQLDERGIEVELPRSSNEPIYPISVGSHSSSSLRDALYELELQERRVGPWEFNVEIPMSRG